VLLKLGADAMSHSLEHAWLAGSASYGATDQGQPR
jgi:hypothetical protein